MTNRKILKDYIINGGDKFLCSPQIGAGAGFDTKIANKKWISDTTMQDTINACEKFDMIPLFNGGIMDLTELVDNIYWEVASQTETPEKKTAVNLFVTPVGTLEQHVTEHPIKGGVATKYLIDKEEELDVLDYYLDSLLSVSDFSPVTNSVQDFRNLVGEDQAIDIQWPMQPYELLCFPDVMNTAIFASLYRDKFLKLMDKILQLNEKLIPAVAKGGSDFVFLGGPGSEMISPQYYEDFLVPYSKIVTDIAHKEGLLVYSHICSPIEPMLTKGYYNKMGIDLFETLSEPPVGNVKNIRDAFEKLDPRICTRGNVGLDSLLQDTPQQIKDKSLEILATAKDMGRKHILAASDYLFYDIPTENVQAMCDAVNEFNNSI